MAEQETHFPINEEPVVPPTAKKYNILAFFVLGCQCLFTFGCVFYACWIENGCTALLCGEGWFYAVVWGATLPHECTACRCTVASSACALASFVPAYIGAWNGDWNIFAPIMVTLLILVVYLSTRMARLSLRAKESDEENLRRTALSHLHLSAGTLIVQIYIFAAAIDGLDGRSVKSILGSLYRLRSCEEPTNKTVDELAQCIEDEEAFTGLIDASMATITGAVVNTALGTNVVVSGVLKLWFVDFVQGEVHVIETCGGMVQFVITVLTLTLLALRPEQIDAEEGRTIFEWILVVILIFIFVEFLIAFRVSWVVKNRSQDYKYYDRRCQRVSLERYELRREQNKLENGLQQEKVAVAQLQDDMDSEVRGLDTRISTLESQSTSCRLSWATNCFYLFTHRRLSDGRKQSVCVY
jgi:hypothetical protein